MAAKDTAPVQILGLFQSEDLHRQITGVGCQLFAAADWPEFIQAVQNSANYAQTNGHHAQAGQSPATGTSLQAEWSPPGHFSFILADLEELQANRDEWLAIRPDVQVPVFIVSSQTHFGDRLEALRLGSTSFFASPVDISEVLNRLESYPVYEHYQPPRIMIIHGDRASREKLSELFEEAHYLVQTLPSPENLLSAIHLFEPDLVITAQDFGQIKGTDIIHIINQHEKFFSIPVIYMFEPSRDGSQFDALAAGCELCLSSAISSENLLKAVKGVAARGRQLSARMLKDGLTGLWNHTSSKMQLERELHRAHRQDSTLVCAILDLDHFKLVNDEHGHATGDLTLKNLARLLVTSLRRADFVGRLGGEEFLILLPDTSVNSAIVVLDRLRESFAQLTLHSSVGRPFHVSFSCGVASSADHPSADGVMQAADEALYAAKRDGRNQIYSYAKSTR